MYKSEYIVSVPKRMLGEEIYEGNMPGHIFKMQTDKQEQASYFCWHANAMCESIHEADVHGRYTGCHFLRYISQS